METDKSIYYLPGRGGQLNAGLGQALLARGFEVTGRATVDEFNHLPFQDQIETISQDLLKFFWSKDSKVIANSFGAYLFLHAQTLLDPFPGKVLLLSPIVGEFSNDEKMMNFIPPRAGKLMELASSNLFPNPNSCQMHVGSEDWQSNPESVNKFADFLKIKAFVVNGAGHQLPIKYVSNLLDTWLNSDS